MGPFCREDANKRLMADCDVKNNPTYLMVVAGAISDGEGRWLMHRRPLDKAHGGLWEFPGGKVEVSEKPTEALVRELREELDIEIDPAAIEPVSFAQRDAVDDEPGIVILLYRVGEFAGTPRAVEGEGIGWFTVAEIDGLERPPLDVELAAKLRRLFPE